MSPAVKSILERVATWPAQDQEELAAVAREIEARRTGRYVLDDDERAGIEQGLKDVKEGRFASEEEVARISRKRVHPGLVNHTPAPAPGNIPANRSTASPASNPRYAP